MKAQQQNKIPQFHEDPFDKQQVLTKSQKREIKKTFDFFDMDGSGTIDLKNLSFVLKALDFNPTNEEIYKLINDLGQGEEKQDSSKIDFNQFLQIMIAKMSEKDSPEDIKKAFRLFSDHQSNRITLDSLKRAIFDLEGINEQQIHQLLKGVNIKACEVYDFGKEKQERIANKGGEYVIDVDEEMFTQVLSQVK